MREDEQAHVVADAVARAWSSGKLDVEAALGEIESEPKRKESNEQG